MNVFEYIALTAIMFAITFFAVWIVLILLALFVPGNVFYEGIVYALGFCLGYALLDITKTFPRYIYSLLLVVAIILTSWVVFSSGTASLVFSVMLFCGFGYTLFKISSKIAIMIGGEVYEED